jgi:hypothetical protein
MALAGEVVGVRAALDELRSAGGVRARRGRLRGAAFAVGALVAVVIVGRSGQMGAALAAVAGADVRWVLAGIPLEAAALLGYVVVLHALVSSASPRLRPRDSYDIALAGSAATRLLPTAGLGGAAVTVWALRSRGIPTREVAKRMIAFLSSLYAIYAGALIVAGAAVCAGAIPVAHGGQLGSVALAVGAGLTAGATAVATRPRRSGRCWSASRPAAAARARSLAPRRSRSPPSRTGCAAPPRPSAVGVPSRSARSRGGDAMRFWSPSQTSPSTNWWTANDIGNAAGTTSSGRRMLPSAATPMGVRAPAAMKLTSGEKHIQLEY